MSVTKTHFELFKEELNAGGTIKLEIKSDSMAATLPKGTIIELKRLPARGLSKGSVAAFWNGKDLVIHRLSTIHNGKLYFRGDMNICEDPPVDSICLLGIPYKAHKRNLPLFSVFSGKLKGVLKTCTIAGQRLHFRLLKRINCFVVTSSRFQILRTFYTWLYFFTLKIVTSILKLHDVEYIFIRKTMANGTIAPGISDIDLVIIPKTPIDKPFDTANRSLYRTVRILRRLFPILGYPAIYSAKDLQYILNSGGPFTEEVPTWVCTTSSALTAPPVESIPIANQLEAFFCMRYFFNQFCNNTWKLIIAHTIYPDAALRAQRDGISLLRCAIAFPKLVQHTTLNAREVILEKTINNEFGDFWKDVAKALKAIEECTSAKDIPLDILVEALARAPQIMNKLYLDNSFHELTDLLNISSCNQVAHAASAHNQTSRADLISEIRSALKETYRLNQYELLVPEMRRLMELASWDNVINALKHTCMNPEFIERIETQLLINQITAQSYTKV